MFENDKPTDKFQSDYPLLSILFKYIKKSQ